MCPEFEVCGVFVAHVGCDPLGIDWGDLWCLVLVGIVGDLDFGVRDVVGVDALFVDVGEVVVRLVSDYVEVVCGGGEVD